MLKESGRRVAFIMVDALRYELGVTLHRQLAETEQAEIRLACAQLPTVTPVGMASLLPGAGAGLRLSKDGDGFCVTLDGAKIASVANRMEAMRARFGDRFAETRWTRSSDPRPSCRSRSSSSCCVPSTSTATWRTPRQGRSPP